MIKGSRKKEIEKINWIFNTLLLKIQKHPMHLTETEITKLWMRAMEISKTIGNLEYLYNINGDIDKNLIEGEEIYE